MDNNKVVKIISIIFYSLFAASIVFGIVFAVNNNEEPLLIWTYALSLLAIGSTLFFGLANMFRSKKSAITSALVFVGFAALVGMAYAVASDVIPTDSAGELIEITANGSRWSGALLFSMYTLLGLSFVSLLYTEIKGALK